MPAKVLSGYQYFMQSKLKDKNCSFSDAVAEWAGCTPEQKAQHKEAGSKIPTKVKGPRKSRVKEPIVSNEPEPVPAPAEEKQVSTPAPAKAEPKVLRTRRR